MGSTKKLDSFAHLNSLRHVLEEGIHPLCLFLYTLSEISYTKQAFFNEFRNFLQKTGTKTKYFRSPAPPTGREPAGDEPAGDDAELPW